MNYWLVSSECFYRTVFNITVKIIRACHVTISWKNLSEINYRNNSLIYALYLDLHLICGDIVNAFVGLKVPTSVDPWLSKVNSFVWSFLSYISFFFLVEIHPVLNNESLIFNLFHFILILFTYICPALITCGNCKFEKVTY